jgi:hypothetical protein
LLRMLRLIETIKEYKKIFSDEKLSWELEWGSRVNGALAFKVSSLVHAPRVR